MAGQMVAALARFAIFILLVIKQVDLAPVKYEDSTALVQLAQKDFGAFLQYATESSSEVHHRL
jgi:hypothetical protein